MARRKSNQPSAGDLVVGANAPQPGATPLAPGTALHQAISDLLARFPGELPPAALDALRAIGGTSLMETPGQQQKSFDLIRGWGGVTAETGLSRVHLWRLTRAGLFPAPIELGGNALAWRRQEIEAWKQSRPRRRYGTALEVA